MTKLRTGQHDVRGNNFFRVVRLNALNKILPLGNYRHGVGLRPALVLLVLHNLGKPIFMLLIRHEQRLHRFYQLIRNKQR